MNTNVKKAILALVVVAIGYAGSYVAVRVTRTDKSVKDGKTYVVFPNQALATFYRPMSALDAVLTGTGARVGTAGETIEVIE